MVAHSPVDRVTIDCDVLPEFTAAYLRVAGDECAFIEAHTSRALPRLLAALDAQGLRPEQVRWVVVTHAHLDHAAGASALLARCPNATLLAHPRAARHLIDPQKLVASAKGVYGEARFEELYGTIDPIPAQRVRALEDGATFELGSATLRVVHTAGHAKHHFVVDDPAIGTVYTGDTFGLVYPALQRAGRFALATTSPTDFDPDEARRSIDKVLALGEEAACLTHYGEVRDLDEVAGQVRAWIDRSEAWLEAAANREARRTGDATLAALTEWIAGELRAAIGADTAGRGLTLGASDWSLLATDIDLNAQGIAFVADKKRNGAS
jgi:glyoxylase-like metal-dependent hydrolase (beta-lactamase superfamily II)